MWKLVLGVKSPTIFCILSQVFLVVCYLVQADSSSIQSPNSLFVTDFDDLKANSTGVKIEKLNATEDQVDDDDSDDDEDGLDENNNTRRFQKARNFPLKGWHIGVVLIISLVILVLLYILLAYDALPCKKKAQRETIPCYLCDKRIDKAKWDDGSHRRSCAIKKRFNLDRMAKPLEVHCPNCNSVLRLWTSNLAIGFHCDDSECRAPGNEIKNSGFNRLNCFICDYDICMACANRKICKKQGVKPNAQRKLGTGLNTTAWMIHMNPLAQQSFKGRKSSTRTSSSSIPGGRKISKTKAKLRSQKRSKSMKETRMRSTSSIRKDSLDVPDKPLIPKDISSFSPLKNNNKRIPKITFKARSVEFDETTELHTVQVNVEFVNESPSSRSKEMLNVSSNETVEQIV